MSTYSIQINATIIHKHKEQHTKLIKVKQSLPFRYLKVSLNNSGYKGWC